jgi:predicted short-subunit dehydrogenase-like oxidoreductase (DUF2520 family)
LADADLYLVAVSDDAVSDVSKSLRFEDRLVAHTSGTLPMEAMDGKNRRAVFYPLQTFSRARRVDFSKVPVCLESEHRADYEILDKVARSISGEVFPIDRQQRKALHVAAVFANNFSNHLFKIAGDICAENQIPFDILKPLIAETTAKIETLAPSDAQTGPASRHDQKTIDAHLAFLADPGRRKIYETLTQSILDNGKKL